MYLYKNNIGVWYWKGGRRVYANMAFIILSFCKKKKIA